MNRLLPVTFRLLLSLAAFPLHALGSPDVLLHESITTQLPRNVRPRHYEIAVVPHADTLAFDGKVKIGIDVLESTRSLTLNASHLRFSEVSFSRAGGESAKASRIDLDAKAQTATFTFADPIAAGSGTLTMTYTGSIATQASGLFAIDYDTTSGTRRALYTQFENSDARAFIPCWDEPAYKATFDLGVTIPSGFVAVSNMPAAESLQLGNDLTQVRFATSPKMSTYLLFLAVGDFERATTKLGDIEVGVVTQRGRLAQAEFALASSQAVLREYNDYFGVTYPLPKLDNIASPGKSQFFGAMENWGAIFSFEHILLLDPSISTQADKQAIFRVAAHEIAHQWFGDLVTMQWWDDLWLNEGFASWMSARTTQKLHPEWQTGLDAVESRERAMALDAVSTTHPVVQHIETVEQASQAFDAITYSKGAAVIAMLEGYVGEDAWRDGVRRYMKKHAYANTQSDDLWREVEAAADKPILAIAHDFTLQPGIPLLTVESVNCHDGDSTVVLRQGEFSKDTSAATGSRKWRVPVIVAPLGGAPVRAMVTDGKASIEVPGCEPVLVNAGQSGYYRTRYAAPQFRALRDRFGSFAAIDQLGLFGDTWAQGMSGAQPMSNALELVGATPLDANPQVWGYIAGRLRELDGFYRGETKRRTAYRAFAVHALAPVLARIGWEARADETTPTTILRADLIQALGDLGDESVIAEARQRHAASKDSPSRLPAALRKSVLAVVARHADERAWENLERLARAEKTPLIKDQYYGLLAAPEDEALALRALKLALTDEPGATNSAAMISKVAALHPDLALGFAVAHREQVDRIIDGPSRSRYYPRLASEGFGKKIIGELKAYSDRHIAPTSRRAADTAIAEIEFRTRVRDQRLPEIDAWLGSLGEDVPSRATH